METTAAASGSYASTHLVTQPPTSPAGSHVSKCSDLSSDSDELQDYDARAELQETYAMIDDMDENSDFDEMCKDTDGWIKVQNA